ncbi:FecR family protein [Sinomicrobium oceani]|uniref:FecR family protein n=1 Tax=Sinomicrobium oceani TaxID=1150368 RepID=A0A1K1RPI4_9FLAO|nr:FecR family protein [Sinomicrobium oceani]SFW73942.1 FecR family protein [Sinomicrobium oceani]
MINFIKITNLAKKLADMVLRGKTIEKKDIEGDHFSDEDKDYVITHLSDPGKVEARKKLAKEVAGSKNRDWQKVEAIIRPVPRKRKIRNNWMKAAAVFTGLITMGYVYYKNMPVAVAPGTEPGGQQITLRLPDGSIRVLEEDHNGEIRDQDGQTVGTRRGSRIHYRRDSESRGSGEVVYHEIYIPFGKTFQLELSDGTVVNLNAGSSLKYPVHFGNTGNRAVYLDGEAYFDVRKNPAQPFVVRTGDINVQVLGTRFVVNSYKEESRIRTVLVEGSVALYKKGEVYTPEKAAMLAPGQKATWDKTQKDLSFEEVDTGLYTGWLNGKLIFNHVRFGEILRRLERYYDITIINKNKALNDEIFTAGFEGEPIENVLNAFGRSYTFEYTIAGQTITIAE